MDTIRLIDSHALISDQIDKPSLKVVLDNLKICLDNKIEGEIVELGCYIGTTSLFIRRLLNSMGSNKAFHVYDSFEGLPPKSGQDASIVGSQFKAGELKGSKKDFRQEFKKANLRTPIIHKGWFSDLTSKDLPDKIAFAFLDGDFYESILTSLKLAGPRLSQGGIICIDDYKSESLPGVEKAVIGYLGSDERVIKIANIGIVTKL